MASVLCPSCGIKVRAGRDRCPRCRQPLLLASPAPAGPQPAAGLAPPSGAFLTVVAAAVLLIAGAAGFALWRAGEPTAAFPAAGSPISAPPKASVSRPERRADLPAVQLGADRFVEPAQGGGLAYAGGDYNQALALYEDAVARRPQDAETWSNLGQVLVRLNRVEQSIEKFERAIELNPDRWTYHFNLARAHGLLGNWESAVEEYRAAERRYPDDYATAFNLGLALRKAGDDVGAVDAFKRAIELDSQEPTFHFSLAGAYEKLGRVADAVAEYRRTLELAGAAPEAPAIQERISRLKGESPKPAAAPASKEPAPTPESGR